MQNLLRLASAIDKANEQIGRWSGWLALAMVLIGAFNAVARYLSRFIGADLSSNAYIELQWYMFSALFLLGAAYTLKHNAHVRVDVLFGRLSKTARCWINLAGTVLFLIPFCVLAIIVTWPSVRNSWAVFETSPDPGGLPRYPVKTLIPLAFVLLILQGVSFAIKQAAALRGHKVPEIEEEHMGEGV
jgi:TRAP-type mannitol/chloroaromatic compound transport system permease small subunit